MIQNIREQRSLAELVQVPSTWYRSCKGVVEFFGALLLLVLAAPVILVAAALVKLTSRGPAFYSQTRLGRHGRSYTIHKLRTMRHNCEKESGPCWSTNGDSRITHVGHFLRRSHIDELPQLWNVLKGDMALVGPRPERPEFVPELTEAIPLYRARLLVRPGMTGLAQVQLPPDTDLDSVRRKLAYDLYYIRRSTPWLDLKLLVATGLHVLHLPYPLVGHLVTLPSGKQIESDYQQLSAEHEAAVHAETAPTQKPAAVGGFEMVPLRVSLQASNLP